MNNKKLYMLFSFKKIKYKTLKIIKVLINNDIKIN